MKSYQWSTNLCDRQTLHFCSRASSDCLKDVAVHDGNCPWPWWSGCCFIASKYQIQWWLKSIKVITNVPDHYYQHFSLPRPGKFSNLIKYWYLDCRTPITYIECQEFRIIKPHRSQSIHRHAVRKHLQNDMVFRRRIRTKIYTETITQLRGRLTKRVLYGVKRRPKIIRSSCQNHQLHQTSFNRRETTTMGVARVKIPQRHPNQLW